MKNGGRFGLAAWRLLPCLIVAGLIFFFFYRRTQEQNTRVYAAITRLQTGVLTQQQLMERSRRAHEDVERGPSPAERSAKASTPEEERRTEIANCTSARQKTLPLCKIN